MPFSTYELTIRNATTQAIAYGPAPGFAMGHFVAEAAVPYQLEIQELVKQPRSGWNLEFRCDCGDVGTPTLLHCGDTVNRDFRVGERRMWLGIWTGPEHLYEVLGSPGMSAIAKIQALGPEPVMLFKPVDSWCSGGESRVSRADYYHEIGVGPAVTPQKLYVDTQDQGGSYRLSIRCEVSR